MWPHWNTGTLEHWNTGTLEHWNTGTLEHWNTGTLEHNTTPTQHLAHSRQTTLGTCPFFVRNGTRSNKIISH
ncbi:hypothetical protein FDK33_08020 [Citrobacter werkmanii]|nr:hypothetical protein [Citrobacter werkmanii]MBQ4935888.1 hypothetical protein [Citrobacter werkmanii]MBQ4947992.1 hypothetical protein [Citrobacter werkmanii]MBQ4964386.1 hypothetical protein [Citrobacter werkmanii]